MINRTIAHYHITEKLGEGGMGEVYRGRDTKLNSGRLILGILLILLGPVVFVACNFLLLPFVVGLQGMDSHYRPYLLKLAAVELLIIVFAGGLVLIGAKSIVEARPRKSRGPVLGLNERK